MPQASWHLWQDGGVPFNLECKSCVIFMIPNGRVQVRNGSRGQTNRHVTCLRTGICLGMAVQAGQDGRSVKSQSMHSGNGEAHASRQACGNN